MRNRLKSSLMASVLKSGETSIWIQETFYFEGAQKDLSSFTSVISGISIEEIKIVF